MFCMAVFGSDLEPPRRKANNIRTINTTIATKEGIQKTVFVILGLDTVSSPFSRSPGLATDESAVLVGDAVEDTSVGDAALRSAGLAVPTLALPSAFGSVLLPFELSLLLPAELLALLRVAPALLPRLLDGLLAPLDSARSFT